MPDLIATLAIDDLPEGLQYVAEKAGMEVARLLLTHCPGMEIRVPVRVTHRAAKRYVWQNYDQTRNNVRELAVSLQITERHVYRLLREKADRVAA